MFEDEDMGSEERLTKPSPEEIEELKGRLLEATSLAEERLVLLMRCRADIDNLIKRTLKEK